MENRIKEIDGKFYDFGTSNQSFLDVAEELKADGVKNYYFMLEIKNQELINNEVIIHNATAEQQAMINTEVQHNFWYFIRECVGLKTDDGYTFYKLTKQNAAMNWCFVNSIDVCIIGDSQMYKTSSVMNGPVQWLFNTCDGVTINIAAPTTQSSCTSLTNFYHSNETLPICVTHSNSRKSASKFTLTTDDGNENIISALEIPSVATDVSSFVESTPSTLFVYDDADDVLFMKELISSRNIFKTYKGYGCNIIIATNDQDYMADYYEFDNSMYDSEAMPNNVIKIK